MVVAGSAESIHDEMDSPVGCLLLIYSTKIIDGEIATGGVLDAVSENSEVHFIPALGGGEV